tara:strand:+ start:37 stop:825 length:789 start_codon:yes stop_codon:yes gene_type:complete
MSGGSTTTKENKPWDEQIPYLTAGFDQAAKLYDRGVPDYYSGQTLAGFTPAQAAAHRGIANYATGPRAGAQQAYAEKAQMGGLTGGVDTSTFTPMMESLGRQMQGQLTGTVLPGIRSKMVQYQPGGSSRGDLVQSQAISSANQQMLNKAAEMYQNAYQGAQSRVPEFLRQYPSTLEAPMSMYSSLGDVGKQQQALNQSAINNAMQAYQYKANAPQSALQDYMKMVQGDYGGTERSTGPSAFGSNFMGALGTGLAKGITGGLF